MKPGRPPGRPPIEIDLRVLGQLAGIGCTHEEAAAVLGCGLRTLKERIAKDEATGQAWENGKLIGKVSLRRLQIRHANGNGSSAVNMTIHLSKHRLGQVDQHKHSGAVGVYDLSKLTDQQLAAVEKILSGAVVGTDNQED